MYETIKRNAIENVNDTQHRMIDLLCRGPRFNERESFELSRDLFQMQTIFTETRLCLPVHFDICVNIDWISDFTYIRHPSGEYQLLDMTKVITKK